MGMKAVLFGILAILCSVYFSEIGQWLRALDREIYSRFVMPAKPPKIWERSQLEKYKHLVIFGHIFDVSSKPQFYGPKGHYNGFTGGDNTRAFASSDLTEESYQSSVEGLLASHHESAFQWLDSFHEKYPFIGFLNDIYFDDSGQPTSLYLNIKAGVEAYQKTKKTENSLYPDCNMDSAGNQFSVNCVDGFDGEWYPRLFIAPSTPQPRCACVRQNYLNSGRMALYPRCPEFSHKCHFTESELKALLAEFQGSR